MTIPLSPGLMDQFLEIQARSPRARWLKVCADSSVRTGLWSNHGIPADVALPGRAGRRLLRALEAWNGQSDRIEALARLDPARLAHARDGLILARRLQRLLPHYTVVYHDARIRDHLGALDPHWDNTPSFDLDQAYTQRIADPQKAPLGVQIMAEHGHWGLWPIDVEDEPTPVQDPADVLQKDPKMASWVERVDAWSVDYSACIDNPTFDWIGHGLQGLDLALTLQRLRPDMRIDYIEDAFDERLSQWRNALSCARDVYEYPVGPAQRTDPKPGWYRSIRRRQYRWHRRPYRHRRGPKRGG